MKATTAIMEQRAPLIVAQRQLRQTIGTRSADAISARKKKIADTLRHETDVLFHRDLKRANEGKPRATLEDLTTLSKQLNVAMKAQGLGDYWIKASPPSARARRRLPPPRSPPPSHPLHSCSTTWTMTALGRFATRSFRAWCERSSTCRLGWPRMRRCRRHGSRSTMTPRGRFHRGSGAAPCAVSHRAGPLHRLTPCPAGTLALGSSQVSCAYPATRTPRATGRSEPQRPKWRASA